MTRRKEANTLGTRQPNPKRSPLPLVRLCPRCGHDEWVHLMAIVRKRRIADFDADDQCINCYDCSGEDAIDDDEVA